MQRQPSFCLTVMMLALVLAGALSHEAQAQQKKKQSPVPAGKHRKDEQPAGDKAGPMKGIMTAQDKADMIYVRKLPHRGTRAVFDLSDPPQYRYLLRQWELAGITRERHPQLFKSIDALRQKHIEQRGNAPRPLNVQHDLVPVSTNENPIVPINLISSFGQTYAGIYAATAFSSIPGTLQDPSTVAVNTLGFYDQNDNLIGQVSSTEQYAAGFDLNNTVTATIPPGVTTLYAAGTYHYVDSHGNSQSGPLNATLTLSALGNNLAADVGTYTMVNQQPTDVKGDGIIKVCIIRQDADCDYVYQTVNGQFVVQFPIQATFTIPEPLQSLTNQQNGGSIEITVTQPNANQGGGCTLPSNFNFYDPTKVTISGNTMTWLFNPGPFSNPTGQTTPCFPSNSTVTYKLQIQVLATHPGTGGTDYFWGSIISRDNPPPPPPGGTYILPMVVAYGCVAEGTLVTMADGTRRKIESVGVNDRIISQTGGHPLTVGSFTRGVEPKPMYRLTTANGHSVLLTETHPVMTTGGMKMVRSVKTGDEVLTEDGPSAVQNIVQESFQGSVWNLNVGATDARVGSSNVETTFFANGILVGDGHMQKEIELAERSRPRDILKTLPKEWRQDYLNALADSKAGSHGNTR